MGGVPGGLQPLDPIDTKRLEAVLRHKLPGLRVLWTESTKSTNRDLLHSMEDDPETGWTVLVADYQTAGRGRHQRRWFSPAGGLYMSVLIKLDDARSPVTLLPLVAGLALKEAVEAEAKQRGGSITLRLKWPNDVLSPNGKLAGVLCESQEIRSGWAVVVGAGVNFFPLDAEQQRLLLYPSTSLQEEADLDWTRSGLLTAFLPRLADRVEAWKFDPSTVQEDWLKASDAKGRRVRVKSGKDKEPVEGVIRGVAENGALIIMEGDTPHIVNSAESIEELDHE